MPVFDIHLTGLFLGSISLPKSSGYSERLGSTHPHIHVMIDKRYKKGLRFSPLGSSFIRPMSSQLSRHPLFTTRTEFLSVDERVSLSYRRARLIMQTYSMYSFVDHCATRVT